MPRFPLLLAALLLARNASGQTVEWTFDTPPEGLGLPAKLATRTAEAPGAANQVLRIATDVPHHTIVKVANSENTPDFVLSLRAKLEAMTGTPPTIYLYGRQGGTGFRGLQVARTTSQILCWKGKGQHNPHFGPAGLGLARKNGWLRLKFACVGDLVAAKAWLDGKPEPGWQVLGKDGDQPTGWAGFGVWTHPKTPSSAVVLFDDVAFTAIQPGQAEGLGLVAANIPQLTAAALAKRQGVFEIDGNTVLASPKTALLIDSRTGDIASILDRTTEQEFITDILRQPLFRGSLLNPRSGDTEPFSARDFGHIRLDEAAPDTVRIAFSEHLQYALKVTATIRMDATGTHRFGIAMENGSDWAIADLEYPLAPAPSALAGDGSDDRMILPWSAGGLLPAPGQIHARRSAAYPGAAYAQFTAHYNDRSGIYWAAEDGEGYPKIMNLRSMPGTSCGIHFTHRFPALAGQDIALPYDVAMTTFQGDWMDAADRYGAWAKTQPWCATKLTSRTDIPAFLKEGSGIIISPVQSQSIREKLFGKGMERLPKVLNAYREATGLKHMVFIPYGWENRGTWAGINYLPAVPSNEFWQRMNQELRRHGHRTAFLTSGYWWVVKRQKTGNGAAFDDTADFEQRQDMCVQNLDGTVWGVDWYERTKQHGSWRGYSVGLCHGSKDAQAALKKTFLQAAALGVPLVSFDQEIGGSQHAPCYHPDHGHTPGWGRWMWTDFEALCQDILKEGKPIQPELGLFLENVSELAIPYMATYWSRQFGEVDIGNANGRGIGLFSYLYHDYVTMIGAACVQGQGKLGTRPDYLLRCRILANNLTRGLIPGPFMHDVPLTGGDKWRRPVAAAYRSFCRPYAQFPQYLLLGETCRPPRLECGSVPTFYYRQDQAKGKPLRPGGPPVRKIETSLETVATGSFTAADGSVGTVIVNATDQPRQAVVHLEPKRTHLLHGADGTPLVSKFGRDGQLSLDLEPFGVRFLISR
ncbi:MAG: hypothetical protein HN380_22300 [Victivallales bacterium]|nr:hypothetical protein [Victivallales bacterium]